MLTDREIKFAVLRVLSRLEHEHRDNLVGVPYPEHRSPSPIENVLGRAFTDDERHQAHRAIRRLEESALIRRSSSAMRNRGEWLEITEAGRRALERSALDPLDRALDQIGRHLPEDREKAWRSIDQATPEDARQAAATMREVVDHVLRSCAPDEIVRSQSWFRQVIDAREGTATRTQRAPYTLQSRLGPLDGGLFVHAESVGVRLSKSYSSLTGEAHKPRSPDVDRVRRTMTEVELLLKELLTGGWECGEFKAGNERVSS